MDPFWAISWFFISSLHSPLSVRSFSRCGFTIYGSNRKDTWQPFPPLDTRLWRHKTSNAFSADLKLSWEHPAGINVAGVGLNWLVVAQDLGSGGCGHGGQEQTVPHTMPEDTQKRVRNWIRDELLSPHTVDVRWKTSTSRKMFRRTYLAIFSFSAFQSHKSVGVLPHMSYWRIWKTQLVRI